MSPTRIFLSLSPIAFLLSGTSAFAHSGPWTVSEVEGQVVIRDESGEKAARRGAKLDPGDSIEARNGGNAIIVRERQFVTIRPNTRIRIADGSESRSVLQVMQDWGRALFRIDKQKDPHFGVGTPYLAAVVKGTTFTVTVGAEGATVQVTEGAVEVETEDGGARDLILPGVVAMVSAGDRMRLVVEGDGQKVIDSPNRVPGQPQAGAVRTPVPTANPNANAIGRVQEIGGPIGSSPIDLDQLSGGFIQGEIGALAGNIVAEAARSRNPSDGRGDGGGSDNGNGDGGPPDGRGDGGGSDNGNGDGGPPDGRGDGGGSDNGNGNVGPPDGRGDGGGSDNGNGDGGPPDGRGDGGGSDNGNGNDGPPDGRGDGGGSANGNGDRGPPDGRGDAGGSGNGGLDSGNGSGGSDEDRGGVDPDDNGSDPADPGFDNEKGRGNDNRPGGDGDDDFETDDDFEADDDLPEPDDDLERGDDPEADDGLEPGPDVD